MDIKELIGRQVIISLDGNLKNKRVYIIQTNKNWKIQLTELNGDAAFGFNLEHAIISLENGNWRFVATKSQADWMRKLWSRKDLQLKDMRLLNNIMIDRTIPWYSIEEKKQLNEMRNKYK